METLESILVGIIGSLIAAVIIELLRVKSNWFPDPSAPPPSIPRVQSDTDIREMNRQRVKLTDLNLFFYLYTFYLFYLALALPPIIRETVLNVELLLSNAKFIGEILPEVPISKDMAQPPLLIIALLLYIPALFFINFLARILAPSVDKFWRVTIPVWRKIQGILFVFFSACLAVISIWMFYPLTLKDASLNFFGLAAIGALFILAGKR